MNASPRNDEKGIKDAGEGKDVRNTLTTDYVREGSYMKIASKHWVSSGAKVWSGGGRSPVPSNPNPILWT